MLAIGPDGLLYVSVGEGATLLAADGTQLAGPGGYPVKGALVRLDVSSGLALAPGGGTFPAPVWAMGLRHPWRFSFDRATGDMYLGDVGENSREEVNFERFAGRTGGRNYGWNTFEGTYCFGQPGGVFDTNCMQRAAAAVFPVADYSHAAGDGAIIGGYVYRGKNIPCLTGTYLFGDYKSSAVRAIVMANGVLTAPIAVVPTLSYFGKGTPALGVTSFGEDAGGELFIINSPSGGSASIYRIDPR
jgi:glucose/arabinose dehydrogenase